jgi:hypothetical protein
MKRIVWMFVLLATTVPTWAANDKITVQQLKDLLVSMKQGKKTDEEVSTRLKEIDLSEELTSAVASDLLFASVGASHQRTDQWDGSA